MSYTITMDKSGRIVLPKPVRERLGADENTRFSLDVVLDRIELTPQPDAQRVGKIVEKDGVWVAAATGRKFSASDALREDREVRMHDLARKPGGV